MNSGIFFGLTAALCWGVADFCARGATRLAGTFRTLLTIQIIATGALLLVGLPTGLIHLSELGTRSAWIAAGLNLIILLGAALLYRAFAIGTLAIVSPIAASYAAITAALALISGEHPAPTQLGGIVLTLVGVVIVSAQPAHTPHSQQEKSHAESLSTSRKFKFHLGPGLLEALAAMMLFGIGYWALRVVVIPLGGVTVAFIGKLSDLIVLSILAAILLLIQWRRKVPLIQKEHHQIAWVNNWLYLAFVVPNALLDTTANVAYNIGISQALTSIVSVISSLFSAVTVLLAWIFLSERLTRGQWLAVIVIFIGITLVSA